MTVKILNWDWNPVNLKSNTENAEEKIVHDIGNFPLSAFGEMQTVWVTPKVQVQFPYNINTRIVDINATWSWFASQANSLAILKTWTTPGSTIQLCTKRVLKYNTGQWGLVRFTFIFPTMTDASQEFYIWYGDSTDWYQFWYKGTQFGIFRHQWGVEEFIPQGSFNWTLPSWFNPQLGNVYQIKFQWLGFWAIQFFIEDATTGQFLKVHEIEYANTNSTPSIYNPSLPICIYWTNGTTSADLSWATASLFWAIEWEERELGIDNAFKNAVSSGTNTNVLTIRNKATYVTKVNRVRLKLILSTLRADWTQPVNFDFRKNMIETNTPTWADIDWDNSVVEYNTDWTYTANSGKLITSAWLAKVDSDKFFLNDLDIRIAPGETLTIIADWTNAWTFASITWEELF